MAFFRALRNYVVSRASLISIHCTSFMSITLEVESGLFKMAFPVGCRLLSFSFSLDLSTLVAAEFWQKKSATRPTHLSKKWTQGLLKPALVA